ncbi:4640_t:CDS:2, partial [Paraglomus brasilianum]
HKGSSQVHGIYCCSIKTLSFLAYILRGCECELEQYSEDIPKFVIRLLQNCPPEASGTRK